MWLSLSRDLVKVPGFYLAVSPMWPEILPGFAIMVGALTVSGLALGFIDRWQNGGKVGFLWGA